MIARVEAGCDGPFDLRVGRFAAHLRRLVSAAGMLALVVGCSGADVPVRRLSEEVQTASITPACSVGGDCVSGSCRSGQCEVCDTLSFQFDKGSNAIRSGNVVEQAYSPIQIQTFRDTAPHSRGLAVAYDASVAGPLYSPLHKNVLVSQNSFTDQDVLDGAVSSAAPAVGGASFKFLFGGPVCPKSLTVLGKDRTRAKVELSDSSGRVVEARACSGDGTKGEEQLAFTDRCDITNMSVHVPGIAGIDDLRLCALGKSAAATSSGPGRECGVDVLGGAPDAVDPCTGGKSLGLRRLDSRNTAASLPFSVASASSLCIRVSGDTRRLDSLKLDERDVATASTSATTSTSRANASTGAHTLAIGVDKSCSSVTVEVLAAPGSFDARGTVEHDGLVVSGLNESPAVVNPTIPGQAVTLSARAQTPARRDATGLQLSYEFKIYSPSSCARVASIIGFLPVSSHGQNIPVSVAWAGKDDLGKLLPDGDYLWNAHIAVTEIEHHHPETLTSIDTAFRGVRIFGQSDPNSCRQAIRDAIAAVAVPDPNNRFDVIRNILRCGADTPSSCEIDYFTTVNLQRRAESTRMLNDQISPAEYLHFERDRTRKVRNGDTNPIWFSDFCAGDDDRDLVPNTLDQCPNTPPLTATDDRGCTDSTLPAAPSRADVRTLLASTRITASATCPERLTPAPSKLETVCTSTAIPNAIALKVDNSDVPANCALWYDLEGQAAIKLPNGTTVQRQFSLAVGPPMLSNTFNDFGDSGGRIVTFFGLITPTTIGGDWPDLLAQPGAVWSAFDVTVQTVTASGQRSAIGPATHVVPSHCGED